MIRPIALIALLALCATTVASAQVPVPTPTPNPHVYNDPAMHFEAPADFIPIGMRHVDSKNLDGPTVVAVWAKFPGKENQRTITITLEPYSGNVDGYLVSYQNLLREKVDGVFIDAKDKTTTSNGMPAYWLKATAGAGFSSTTIYQYIWSDGLRGVSVAISGRLGELTEDEAKAALKNISAVLYPIGRI